MSRRTVLTGAAVLLAGAAAGTVGVATHALPGSTRIRGFLGLDGPAGVVPSVPGSVTTRRMRSTARGTSVTVATMVPDGVEPAGLPVLLALHGQGADAQTLVSLGLPEFLTAAVRTGIAPFAIVAVDGGHHYWHRDGSDDPQAMLRDEVPGWLDDAGLGPVQGALGISMGAFGALLWASQAQASAQTAPAAVAVVSPALFRTWDEAHARNAFADEAEWQALEPLRHLDAIDGRTLGVWCGNDDPFLPAARLLATGAGQGRGAAVARYDAGAHTEGYWRRVLPDVLEFTGATLADAPRR